MMAGKKLQWLVCGLVGAMAVAAGGCADRRPMDWSRMWPWGRDKVNPADVAKYGPSPAQRIRDIRELGKTVASASPQEKDRVTLDLARRIQIEQDPIVRAEIIQLLGDHPTPAALAVLRAGVNDPDADVRIACCVAWGKQRSKDAANELSGVLGRDTDRDVRIAAARAFGDLKESATVGMLAVGLDDTDIAVQSRTMQSMKAISGRDYGNDAGKWREFAKGGSPKEPTISVADRMRQWFQ
jgi:hypothetical protein